MLRYILFILLLSCFADLHAQTESDSASARPKISKQDTLQKPKKHSPKKATILSLLLPGAGQVYNQKNWWWKVPLIYGGGGSLLYGAIIYEKGYNDYREAYKIRLASPTGLNNNPVYDRFQTPTLQVIRDSYRDARDQCYVWFVLVYAVQVLDATVEAHFFDFNMNENVSLKIQPQLNVVGTDYYRGVQLTFKF